MWYTLNGEGDCIGMTDFLFARPSVLEGIGRNIDLFGVLGVYNTSANGNEADMKARRNDVETLRGDFKLAYETVIKTDGNKV